MRFNQEAYINFQESAFTGDTSIQGFNAVSRNRNSLHKLRVAEATVFMSKVLTGQEDPWMLRQALQPTNDVAWKYLCNLYPHAFRETMSSSDFSALTADVLDRLLLANYQEQQSSWTMLAKKATLRDFRSVKRFQVDGGETKFLSVAAGQDFERRSISQPTPYTYSPLKYEAGFALLWEDIINDDLGIFMDLVQRLSRGGRRTIEKFATGLFVDANGPHASLFTAGNKNIINTTNGAAATNPPLSIAGMQDAMLVLARQLDSDGEPIGVTGVNLVVGPALYNTAANLKNVELYDINAIGGATNQRARVSNWIMGGINVVQNPQMRILTTGSATIAETQWYLFSDPNIGRPVIEVGFLTGYDTPQLYEKMGNTNRVGGGVDQMLGDFNTMSKEMKALLVMGGTQLDGKGAVSSTGANA